MVGAIPADLLQALINTAITEIATALTPLFFAQWYNRYAFRASYEAWTNPAAYLVSAPADSIRLGAEEYPRNTVSAR
jgi:hypothetical protein